MRPQRCEFKSRSKQRIFRFSLQCQINMYLVFHISENGSEIELKHCVSSKANNSLKSIIYIICSSMNKWSSGKIIDVNYHSVWFIFRRSHLQKFWLKISTKDWLKSIICISCRYQNVRVCGVLSNLIECNQSVKIRLACSNFSSADLSQLVETTCRKPVDSKF